MKKYKLIGITEYAYNHLDDDDLEALDDMVGCEITESDRKSHVDGGMMLDMPDGERTHVDFLQLEEVQDKLKFE